MEIVVMIEEREMEALWKQTSFAHHFDFNPFEIVYDGGNGNTYPYCTHFVEKTFKSDPPRYEVVPLNTEGIEECGEELSSHLCSEAILEWIQIGAIPQTSRVLVQR